jgi:hypothetical protein
LYDSLNLYGKEYIKRSQLRGIRLLRRHFTKLFTIRETRFISKYGIDSEWMRVKVLGRAPWTKIDNYYYRVVVGEAIDSLRDCVKRGDRKGLAENLYSLVRIGIELTLLFSWLHFVLLYIYNIITKVMDVDGIVRVFGESKFKGMSIKILYELADYFNISISILLRMFPHKNHIHSFNSYGKVVKKGYTVDWVGYIERCWSIIFTGYLYKAGIVGDFNLHVVCRLCIMNYEALYEFVPNGFSEVDISSEKDEKYMCVIRIEARYAVEVEAEKEMEEDEKNIE